MYYERRGAPRGQPQSFEAYAGTYCPGVQAFKGHRDPGASKGSNDGMDQGMNQS